MTDLLAVDNSTLAATQACTTKAALRYVLGYTAADDAAPLQAGTAAHAAFAEWLRTGGDVERAMAALAAGYRAWSTEHIDDPDDRLAWPNVERVMRAWFDTHPLATWPVVVPPSMVEVGFALPLADGIVFVGRLDALGRDRWGAVHVVEHKTTGRLDDQWRRTHRLAAQVTGYVWAAQQHVGQPVVGALVNGVEFGRLPASSRKCAKHGLPYAECSPFHIAAEMLLTDRPPHMIDAWRSSAAALAGRFRAIRERVSTIDDVAALPMEGVFTGACARCEFADYCRQGRPTGERPVAAMLRREPWSPFDHAFGPDKETK